MKKAFGFIVVIVLIIFTYYLFLNNSFLLKKVLKNTQKDTFYVDKYTIFGTHLNISGCIDKKLDGDLSLILKNTKEEIPVDSNFSTTNNTCFILSDKNNEGINLDELKLGSYVILVKQIEDENVKYYSLDNKTDYNNHVYYTVTRSKKNNKIDIKFDSYDKKSYFSLNVGRTSLPKEVYDITIDPGHGGSDPGSSYKLGNKVYTESELTLKTSLLLKKDLEKLGLKVKLTRDRDIGLDNYGDNGRAVIANKVKSKYSISLHLNSASGKMNYGGVEVYTPNDINNNLATMFADNISQIVGYSKKPSDKVDSGVYYTYFTKEDIVESKKEMKDKNMKPYDIEVGSPYMFMIREVGGTITHAYIDGRNKSHCENEFYNSNQTAEPYLIELGYINYEKDLENLVNKSNLFSKAISKSIKDYLDIS